MSFLKNARWGFVAALVTGLFLVPVSISPAGSVELDRVCASGDCMDMPGRKCLSGGDVFYDAMRVD